MSLSKLYDMLEKHDWSYIYSDDFSEWKKGDKEYKDICTEVQLMGPEAERMVMDYSCYVFGGKPKQKRPREEL